MSYQTQQSSARNGVVTVSYADLALKLKESIEHVESATERKLRGKDASWTRVLLIGVTGGGKTTLLHALTGRKLVVKENEDTGLLYYDALEPLSDGDQQFTIGNGAESETYIPNVWVDSNNKIIYVDCPGFLDTETDRRLINAFSMDKVLSNAEATGAKVKVLFVVSEKQLSEKGLTARQGLMLISKMFPNIDQLKRAVGVVVTKTNPRVKPVGLLRELQKGNADSALLDKFISDGEQRVFSFPFPCDVGTPSDPIPVKIKERIFSFLESDRVSGLKHELAIESDAEKLVIGLGYWFIEYKAKAINMLAADVERTFSPESVDDINVLSEWRQIIETIQNASKMDWKSFTKFCRELSDQVRVCKNAAQEMEKLVPMEDFIEKVSSASSDAADMINKNRALISNALFRFEIIKGNLASKELLVKGDIDMKKYQDLCEKAKEDIQKVEEERNRLIREVSTSRKGFFERFIDGICTFSRTICDFFATVGSVVKFVCEIVDVIKML